MLKDVTGFWGRSLGLGHVVKRYCAIARIVATTKVLRCSVCPSPNYICLHIESKAAAQCSFMSIQTGNTRAFVNAEKPSAIFISIRHPKVNTLELSAPRGKTRLSSHISYLKTSSIRLRRNWKPNCQVWKFWLFCWYHSFTVCIHSHIHGSVAFQVLLPIDIRNQNHNWNVAYW